MRRLVTLLAVTLLVVGCDQPATPTTPTAPATPTAPTVQPTPATLQSRAVIAVRNPVAIPYSSSGDHDFFFTLVETGGMSGATIQSLVTSIPGSKSTADIGCWVRPMRIQPSSILELTPAVLGYCSPTLNPSGLESVSLRVNYFDDAGRLGATETTIPIPR